MTAKKDITTCMENYLTRFPEETDRCKIFSDYLHRNRDESLYDRKNFDGHITTSAFIINSLASEILLLKHKSLNRWLQPGGHVEGDGSLLQSALREVEEETAITADQLEHIEVVAEIEMPFDIDSHYIPENTKKQEAAHYHHDFRYLFVYDGDGSVKFDPDESTGLKWVPFTELENDETFGAMIRKIRSILFYKVS